MPAVAPLGPQAPAGDGVALEAPFCTGRMATMSPCTHLRTAYFGCATFDLSSGARAAVARTDVNGFSLKGLDAAMASRALPSACQPFPASGVSEPDATGVLLVSGRAGLRCWVEWLDRKKTDSAAES